MLSGTWSASPVEVYVHRACDPSLSEPNYPLNLELAEYVNTKKANTPREAAMTIVRLINHRNPHISILAISLLQTLVQQCGYAFHLQISTKEFLNELVRRFPERPPPFPGPIMSRILDLIHAWKESICRESRFKEDFGNIRDMHRLLSFKGYRFRESGRNGNYNPQDATANLKSPEELEKEDREAQAAKLQELIRRATPRDLAAAQELMKIMAGADPSSKPDYRSKTLHELEKLKSHVMLLNDMLDNVDPARPERMVQGDAFDQVALICRDARPRIQKWISDAESDDPESLDSFLSMNDLINNVLSRYERYQKGDYSDPSLAPGGKQDLIDFDFGTDAPASPSQSNTPSDFFSFLANGAPPNSTATVSSAPLPLFSQSTAIRPSLGAPLPTSSSHLAGPSPDVLNSGIVPGGGGITLGMSSGPFRGSQSPAPQPSSAPSSSAAPSKGSDPFADLAELF